MFRPQASCTKSSHLRSSGNISLSVVSFCAQSVSQCFSHVGRRRVRPFFLMSATRFPVPQALEYEVSIAHRRMVESVSGTISAVSVTRLGVCQIAHHLDNLRSKCPARLCTLLGTMTSIFLLHPSFPFINTARRSRDIIVPRSPGRAYLPCLTESKSSGFGTLFLCKGLALRCPKHRFDVLRQQLCVKPPGLFLAPSSSLPENHRVTEALVLLQDCWRLQRNMQIWLTDSISDEFTWMFSRAAVKCNVA